MALLRATNMLQLFFDTGALFDRFRGRKALLAEEGGKFIKHSSNVIAKRAPASRKNTLEGTQRQLLVVRTILQSTTFCTIRNNQYSKH